MNYITSIEAIKSVKDGNYKILKIEKWLSLLTFTSERNINLERINSLDEIPENYVLEYVEKTLRLLTTFNISDYKRYIIEEVLKWSEVAKSGLAHKRIEWINKGYNIYVHNIGSAQIYEELTDEKDINSKKIIHDLILTHGLIGQYIRGEVSLSENKPLYSLIKDRLITEEDLKEMLYILNYCIINAADNRIWINIEEQVVSTIEYICIGSFDKQISVYERLKKLRTLSIANGEDYETEYNKIFNNPKIEHIIINLIKNKDLWYVEAALYDFTFEEFIKIFLMINSEINSKDVKHINFDKFMNEIYYQHKGKKRVNIYKKRIIEKYLADITLENIIEGIYKENTHVKHDVSFSNEFDDTVFFSFKFSKAAIKLIDFCVEAEKSDVLYESAIIILFDLFGLRKDKYDRFHEEETYLATMNQAIDYKRIILDYIKGSNIIDIGPGGGALMDLIEEKYPDKKVIGVDISQNVLENLKKKKQLENKKWEVVYGDALNLSQYFKSGEIDTIIFCSVLHELFSYIEYEGKKFNYNTLRTVLRSAIDILPIGGRIIIRDGIMTEDESQNRIIRFFSEEGLGFLMRYVKDFKGRKINYKIIGKNEVLMPVNDAMEFLYTYTWGESSYIHEVNEQFGYFTPSKFKKFILEEVSSNVKVIELKHYLQEGYTIALSQKIDFYDENKNLTRLPDSTCIIVIEKVK